MSNHDNFRSFVENPDEQRNWNQIDMTNNDYRTGCPFSQGIERVRDSPASKCFELQTVNVFRIGFFTVKTECTEITAQDIFKTIT
jgi:hypothetical protein